MLQPRHLGLESIHLLVQMVDQREQIGKLGRGHLDSRFGRGTLLHFLLNHVDSTDLFFEVGFEPRDVLSQCIH